MRNQISELLTTFQIEEEVLKNAFSEQKRFMQPIDLKNTYIQILL